jgi:hypothetical protein
MFTKDLRALTRIWFMGGLMYPFEFEKSDVLWDIIKKYGMTPREIREAILAWAYTVAREQERDETWEKLNEAFISFNDEMRNVDSEKMRKIYHL